MGKTTSKAPVESLRDAIRGASNQAALAASAYAVLEVVYYVGDSASFTSGLPWSACIGGALLLACALYALQWVLLGPLAMIARLAPQATRLLPLAPALVIGAVALMVGERMLDPLDPDALVTAPLVWRLGVVVVVAASYARLDQAQASPNWRPTGLLVGAGLAWMVVRVAVGLPGLSDVPSTSGPTSRPNVIFLAADGIEARNLTPYGSPVDTTPNLARLAERSVVYENAFVNAGKTTGSTTSMLNGLHPLQTKVIFPPQLLTGSAGYRHLPGILGDLGYAGMQHSVRFYADAEDLNMVGGFDRANGRAIRRLPPAPLRQVFWVLNDELYVVRRLTADLSDRWLTFGTGTIRVDALRDVSGESELDSKEDRAVLGEALAFVDAHEEPVFLHLHLMGTHCCEFKPQRDRVSEAEAGLFAGPHEEAGQRARYLSTIAEFDDNLGYFLDGLRELGELDNSLIVISSDHSSGWATDVRMPLIVHHPGGRTVGRVSESVELLALPATVLHALEVDAPEWMASPRLRRPGEPAAEHPAPLISVHGIDMSETRGLTRDADGSQRGRRLVDPGPPEFGVAALTVIACDASARWQVEAQEWVHERVLDHTAPCADGPIDAGVLQGVLDRARTEWGVDLVR
ncbi:MAG: sulfatase-like hydrolase/transferase [Proteobacteria bacterium]|nr:sulfatase-like hydrolase/transferase [Pseudomonadota bacterium]